MERELLAAAINSRESYELLASRDVRRELSIHAQVIFDAITTYYRRDESAQSASVELLKESLRQTHEKYTDSLFLILDDLPDVSSINAVDLWLASKQQAIGDKLAQAIINKDDVKIITELIEEYQFYQAYEEEVPRTFIGAHPSELYDTRKTGDLIPVFPKALNNAIGGGADRGSHIVVFGVPEMGKTQFVINAVARMIQDGFRVLYCWNEDPVKKVIDRYLSRLSDIPSDDLRRDPDKQNLAYELAMRKNYGNLILQELLPGTYAELRSLIEKHEPDVLVVDQIRNLSYPRTDGLTEILERAGKDMRNLAKRFDIVTVSVTQAGDSAQGKAILNYNDVEYSNVGLAATADLMIGVGATSEMSAMGQLMLSVSKNKFNGNHVNVPARVYRHLSKVWSME